MENLEVDAITDAEIDAAIEEVLAAPSAKSEKLLKDIEAEIRTSLAKLSEKTDAIARGQDGYYDVSIVLNFGNQGQRYGAKKSVKIYAQYDGEEGAEIAFDFDLK